MLLATALDQWQPSLASGYARLACDLGEQQRSVNYRAACMREARVHMVMRK
jgi:hypothetical protein